MATSNEYEPDYAVPPGWVIAERLAAHDIPKRSWRGAAVDRRS